MKALKQLSLSQKIIFALALSIGILTTSFTTFQYFKLLSGYKKDQKIILQDQHLTASQTLQDYIKSKMTQLVLVKNNLKRIANRNDAELFLDDWMNSSDDLFEYSLHQINSEGNFSREFSLYNYRFFKTLVTASIETYKKDADDILKAVNKAKDGVIVPYLLAGPEGFGRLLLLFRDSNKNKLHLFKFSLRKNLYFESSPFKYVLLSSEHDIISGNLNNTNLDPSIIKSPDEYFSVEYNNSDILFFKKKISSTDNYLLIGISDSPLKALLSDMRISFWLIALIVFGIAAIFIIRFFIPIQTDIIKSIKHFNSYGKAPEDVDDRHLNNLFLAINQYLEESKQALTQRQETVRNLTTLNTKKDITNQELAHVVHLIFSTLEIGFFIFDQKGKITELYNRYFQNLISQDPKGLMASRFFQHENAEAWIRSLFKQESTFEDLNKVSPKRLNLKDGDNFKTAFYPIYDHKNNLFEVICVINDVTQLNTLNQTLTENQESISVTSATQADPIGYSNLISLAKKIKRHIRDNHEESSFADSLNYYHYFFGEVLQYLKFYHLHNLYEHAAEIQGILGSDVKNKSQEEFFSKTQEWLDFFFNTIEDYSTVTGISTTNESDRIEENIEVKDLLNIHRKVFLKVNEELNKQCHRFEIVNQDLIIPYTKYRDFFMALVDIYRNIAIHANRSPEHRSGQEKHEGITVVTTINHDNEFLYVSIEDDGEGIAPKEIRKILIQNGADEFTLSKNDQDIIQLIFQDGLSTSFKKESSFGNGFGLAEIRKAVNILHGFYNVESVPKKGTVFNFKLPL